MISKIKKRGNRANLLKDTSKGSKLKEIENQISCLDKYQSKAVIETVEGVQRIRGLAGSGKTIVLALKVAYLYTMYEDKVIAITFNSRALKGQFIQLITNFIIENTNEEPDWDRIKIIYGRSADAFDKVCQEAVEMVVSPKTLYDMILVDEAQDFSKYFLQMCYMSLPKTRTNTIGSVV